MQIRKQGEIKMNKTAKIINISNVSGGVGKSTTAIELATYFGMQGKKVLIVDADMQASATDCIGAKGQPLTIKELQAMDEKIESGTNFINVLDECLIEDVIVPTEHMNVSLLPASIRLCQADKNLSDDRTRSAVDRLVCAFENVQDRYDYILIDNSPAQTLVSTNTLLASDLNIIPVKLDRKSIKGMIVSLKNTITIAKRNKKNVDLKVLFTMVSPRGKTEKNLIPWFRKHMEDMIFQTIIPYQKKPTQDASMMNRQVVLTNTNVGNAYKSLGEEIIALLENKD